MRTLFQVTLSIWLVISTAFILVDNQLVTKSRNLAAKVDSVLSLLSRKELSIEELPEITAITKLQKTISDDVQAFEQISFLSPTSFINLIRAVHVLNIWSSADDEFINPGKNLSQITFSLLNKAIRLNLTNPSLYLLNADLLLSTKNSSVNSAKLLNFPQSLKRAEMLAPNSQYNQFLMANIKMLAGRKQEALGHYRKFQELSSSVSSKNFNYIISLVDTVEDLREALPRRFPMLLGWISYWRSLGGTQWLDSVDALIPAAKEALTTPPFSRNGSLGAGIVMKATVSDRLTYLERLYNTTLPLYDDKLRQTVVQQRVELLRLLGRTAESELFSYQLERRRVKLLSAFFGEEYDLNGFSPDKLVFEDESNSLTRKQVIFAGISVVIKADNLANTNRLLWIQLPLSANNSTNKRLIDPPILSINDEQLRFSPCVDCTILKSEVFDSSAYWLIEIPENLASSPIKIYFQAKPAISATTGFKSIQLYE